MTCPPLYSPAPFTSPYLSVAALLLTPLSLFSSPRISSPAWLSSSAASNSRLLAANLEGICSPIKVHVQYDFHPFPLMYIFFPLPLSHSPQQAARHVSPCINKDQTETPSSDSVEDKKKNPKNPVNLKEKSARKGQTFAVLLGTALPATMISLFCNGPK